MITGAEFSLIFVVVRKLKSELRSTSTIRKETEAILNDQQLVEMLGVLFELNQIHALKNTERYDQARSIADRTSILKGTKFILVRHRNARNAYSLAKLYEEEVRRNTTDAQIQALRDKAKDLLEQQRNRRKKTNEGKGEEEAPNRGLPTHKTNEGKGEEEAPNKGLPTHKTTTLSANNGDRTENTYINSAPRYVVQSPLLTTFAYPRGTPRNPTVSCPVGSTPTVPEGFKFGTLAFYEASTLFFPWPPLQVVTDFANLEEIDSEADHFVPIASIGNMPARHRPSSNHSGPPANSDAAVMKDMTEAGHLIEILRSTYDGDDEIASIATTYLSFDDAGTGPSDGSAFGGLDEL